MAPEKKPKWGLRFEAQPASGAAGGGPARSGPRQLAGDGALPGRLKEWNMSGKKTETNEEPLLGG